MKKGDVIFLGVIVLLVSPLIFIDQIQNSYIHFNASHGMISSFIKFGILATLGELIGLRIRNGNYIEKGFGILPKVIIWGFIGLTIKLAFVVFAVGIPAFLEYMGITGATQIIKQPFTYQKLMVAFAISAAMNIIYAPVMMTFHKITDIHVSKNMGRFSCLFKPIDFVAAFNAIDWNIQWNFVFKKTIPMFWIPAHTLTFLMPPDFQVLFAALLSIMLGLILAIATLKSKN